MTPKEIAKIARITLILLLIPLLISLFSAEPNWGVFDYVIAGVLIFCAGIIFELISNKSNSVKYKIAVGVATLSTLLLLWANLAVGIIGNENNPANTFYFAIPVIGIIGAILVHFTPRGLSRIMIAMAITQMLIPVIALLIWKPQFTTGVLVVFAVNAFFALLFLGSSLLFKRAQ